MAANTEVQKAVAGWPCLTPAGLRLRFTPVAPSPRQAAFLSLVNREALYGGSAGAGKMLDLSTVVLSTKGWTTMGELQVGDVVFDHDGQPTRVLWKSPVRTPTTYRVTMSDGEVIHACDDHLWNVADERQRANYQHTNPRRQATRRARRPSRGLTDEQRAAATDGRARGTALALIETNARRAVEARESAERPSVWDYTTTMTTEAVRALQGAERKRVAIPNGAPLHAPGAWRSDVPPYTLGVWLGDGRAADGSIYTCEADRAALTAELAADGWTVEVVGTVPAASSLTATQDFHRLKLTRDGRTLGVILRAEGLLGNKHVPDWVHLAPHADRQAFLGGFCDTDGTVDRRGRVEFCLAREDMVRDVHSLFWGIGEKPSRVTERVTRNQVEGFTGVAWRFSIARCSQYLFRLPRKRDRLSIDRGCGSRNEYRSIESIEEVDPRPMQCITVDNPRGLYRVGRSHLTTHNSAALLMGALMFCDVPGYNALILRRTLTDLKLPDGLIDVSNDWLSGTGAKYNANDYRWTFPKPDGDLDGGAVLQFGYMSAYGSETRYKSSQFQYCVERSERVRMADGSLRRIDSIHPGDWVATLVGPRRVTHTFDVGVKAAVRVTTPYGSVVCSPDHPILMSDGTWADPTVLAPTRCPQCDTTSAVSPTSPPAARTPDWHWSTDRRPALAGATPAATPVGRPDLDVGRAGGRTGCAASGGAPPAGLPPRLSTDPAGRLALEPHRGAPEIVLRSRGRALGRESSGPVAAGSLASCDCGPRRGDARPRLVPAVAPPHTPSPAGAGASSPLAPRSGGRARTRGCSPAASATFVHPYTRGLERATVPVAAAGGTGTVPVGDAYLWDIRVGGASHYITESGLIHANCGFDELTEFPWEEQVLYLQSRMRSSIGFHPPAADGLTVDRVPLRLRGATNPGGIGGDWVRKRYVAVDTRIRPFLPGRVHDNPGLNAEEYLASLAELPEVERRRLQDGDWDVFDIPGALWRYDDFAWTDRTEPKPVTDVDVRAMAIDPAVTDETGKGDETGILIGSLTQGDLTVELDLSGRMHPDDWARLAVAEYHKWGCSSVIVEDNQGKALLHGALGNAADQLGLPRPNLAVITAKESKEARAIPVAQAYRSTPRRVYHDLTIKGGRLESQLTSWVPRRPTTKIPSPDRLDALVWLVRHLLWNEGKSATYRTPRTGQGSVASRMMGKMPGT
jgi:hypothetical protein